MTYVSKALRLLSSFYRKLDALPGHAERSSPNLSELITELYSFGEGAPYKPDELIAAGLNISPILVDRAGASQEPRDLSNAFFFLDSMYLQACRETAPRRAAVADLFLALPTDFLKLSPDRAARSMKDMCDLLGEREEIKAPGHAARVTAAIDKVLGLPLEILAANSETAAELLSLAKQNDTRQTAVIERARAAAQTHADGGKEYMDYLARRFTDSAVQLTPHAAFPAFATFSSGGFSSYTLAAGPQTAQALPTTGKVKLPNPTPI